MYEVNSVRCFYVIVRTNSETHMKSTPFHMDTCLIGASEEGLWSLLATDYRCHVCFSVWDAGKINTVPYVLSRLLLPWECCTVIEISKKHYIKDLCVTENWEETSSSTERWRYMPSIVAAVHRGWHLADLGQQVYRPIAGNGALAIESHEKCQSKHFYTAI